MKLKDYPQAIAEATKAADSLKLDLTRVKRQVIRLEHQVDAEIASNPNFRKGALRRAERFRLLDSNLRYQELLDELTNLEHRHLTALAELKRVRNEFSVLKLETRLSMIEKLVDDD